MKETLKKISPFNNRTDMNPVLFIIKKTIAFWFCYIVGLFIAEGVAILLHFALGKNMLIGDVFDSQTITIILTGKGGKSRIVPVMKPTGELLRQYIEGAGLSSPVYSRNPLFTINALACADSILIPVQAAYLPVKGLQQLIKTVGKVKRKMNPKLEIEGILLTMVDSRTNYATII